MVYVVLIILAAGLFAMPRTLPVWAVCIISLAGLVAGLVIAYIHMVVTFG